MEQLSGSAMNTCKPKHHHKHNHNHRLWLVENWNQRFVISDPFRLEFFAAGKSHSLFHFVSFSQLANFFSIFSIFAFSAFFAFHADQTETELRANQPSEISCAGTMKHSNRESWECGV